MSIDPPNPNAPIDPGQPPYGPAPVYPAVPAPPPRKTPVFRAILIMLGVLVALCCVGVIVAIAVGGNENGGTGVAAPTLTGTPLAPTTQARTTPAGCLPVAKALLDHIATGAQDGTGLQMTGRAAAVRSAEHRQGSGVHFIAAEFTATGIQPQVGVWATNRLDPADPGLTRSVDGFAKEFTDWPEIPPVDGRDQLLNPATSLARECLRG